MTRRRRQRRRFPAAPRRLPVRLGWVLVAIVAVFVVGAMIQPAVEAHRETLDAIGRLRREIAAEAGTTPQWGAIAPRPGGPGHVPAFYRLPVTTAPEVEAHARATMLTTQMLDLVKAVGGEVVQVGVEMPQRLPSRVQVPGKLVFRSDFDGVRHLVRAVRGISPHLVWRRCRLSALRPMDEPDVDPLPMNTLTVELAWTAVFYRAD